MEFNNQLVENNKDKKVPSIKDLFNRPGGTFAKMTAVAAALGLGYGFFKALPFLIAGAANTLIFIAELVALVAIIGTLTSKQFWKWVSLFWLQLNRKIVSIFVRIDPISILEQSIENMKEKLASLDTNITTLKAVLIKMKKKLTDYQKDFDEDRAKLKILESRANISENAKEKLQVEMQLRTVKSDIVNLSKMIEDQKARVAISERYQDAMERMKIICAGKVDSSVLQLSRMKDSYEQAKAQNSALKSIKSIMSGDAESLEAEMAYEHIIDTVNMSVAEMERFLDDANGILANDSLETDLNSYKVQEILEKYDIKSLEMEAEPIPANNMVKEAKKELSHNWC